MPHAENVQKMPVSKTQIDRLGDRLKGGPHTESDLRLLDDYRRSFGEAYEAVVQAIRQRGEFPTGRLAKSTLSITEKLRRESLRLSQMQDIAGCRVVVGNVVEQEQFVASLITDFPKASLIDRRNNPRANSPNTAENHRINISMGKMVKTAVFLSFSQGALRARSNSQRIYMAKTVALRFVVFKGRHCTRVENPGKVATE